MYTPKTDFYGTDSIVISINDMGNTGLCYDKKVEGHFCDLSDSFILPIVIAPKEDTLEINSM